MSFEAVLGGRLVVRDSGTGSYTGDARLREDLRDAYAHNVAIVDGQRYAMLGGSDRLWAIDGDAPPRVLLLEREAGRHRLVAEQRLPAARGEALWRREVIWTPCRLALRDVVQAPAGAHVEHHLQLPAADAVPGAVVQRLDAPADAVADMRQVTWSEGYGTRRAGRRLTTRWTQEASEVTVAFEVTA